MICKNCGGTIELDENCPDCGIGYREMLGKVSHPEMRRLFKKLKDLDKKHKRSEIDESLLVCKLENSTLITAAKVEGDGFNLAYAHEKRGGDLLILCTDMDEFGQFEEIGLTPLIMSWGSMLTFLEGDAGIVINMSDECCILKREFLETFFFDEGP